MDWSKRLLFISIAIFFLTFSILGIRLYPTVTETLVSTNETLAETRTSVQAARSDIHKLTVHTSSTLSTIQTQLTVLNNNVNVRLKVVSDAVAPLPTQTAEIEKHLNSALDAIATIAPNVNSTLGVYAKLPDRVVDGLGPNFNCDENSLCYQNSALDTLLSFRATATDVSQTAHEVKQSVPVFLDQGKAFITDSHAVAKNIEIITHPKWYDRLLSTAVSGSSIYFNLFRAGLFTQTK